MTLKTRIMLAVLAAAGMALLISAAPAQEAAAPAPAAAAPVRAATTASEAPAAPETRMTLWKLWLVGGWCMYPLGLTNIMVIAFTVYGFLLVRENKTLVPELIPQLQTSLSRLHLDDVNTACVGKPSMLTNVLHAGMQRISDGVLDVGSMEKAMEEASVEETQAGLRMLNYLSISAQIAPMLGLLGTVSGMIKAFEKIGKGAMGKPELLANDIGEALITTAYGLIIGIPAMAFYFYLKSRYVNIVTKLGRFLGNLTHTLVAASRRVEAPPAEHASAPAEAAAPAAP
ncbi:MAG: MotA/TolQ/ExbB proton channel family protein [Lentisphaerae bacterium]|nr:MotA/TolQ/ExbB proton channel family protein [Lentisphaerota bacterium]